jgi:DNA-binding transcriptional LysR family regulator
MLDLDLLNTLVCVVDEGSFTRAGERVHRTQSTVSQQVRKLEELVGRTLLLRDRAGSNVRPTEYGELLAQYARRLLALSQEAEDALASDQTLAAVRVGVPEDFDARRMSGMLSGFARTQPAARLETVSGMSTDLRHKLAAGDIDVALVKREPGSGECIASWPEELVWVRGAAFDAGEEPVPLALFPQGCVYRQRAIRGLDKAQRRWRVAFGSHSLTGIQAAVSSGLGVTVLPTTAVLADHRECSGMPALPPTELALVTSGSTPGGMQRALIDFLVAELERV